ncbi:hypothetical protein GN958_ATG12370 [Phytophthora infestans]|uniref:Uncharacterized protein n=1 Tax=Phytophthora infestans TaxID=4787 RepID=A0A8S9UGM7_PHYIN|nr:hypothetical protein GN958_ATG12370 [Phytophthora infestans]
MAHSTHSAPFWLQRCINDSSSGDASVSPNVCPDPRRSGTAKGIDAASDTKTVDFRGSTGTLTSPYSSAHRAHDASVSATQPPHPLNCDQSSRLSSPSARTIASPTTSSPVLINTPPRRTPPSKTQSRSSDARNALQDRKESRHSRRAKAAPYSRPDALPVQQSNRPVVHPRGLMRASPEPTLSSRSYGV